MSGEPVKRASWADDTDSDVDEVTDVGLGFVLSRESAASWGIAWS